MHNIKSAAMVHNASPPSLHPGDPTMEPVHTRKLTRDTAGGHTKGVPRLPNLVRQLPRILVIASIAALSAQALASFLQGVLNAAIGFQALHMREPKQTLEDAVATVRQAWAVSGHRPTSLPAAVRGASAPYLGDDTDHLVNNGYATYTAARLRRLMHNQEPEVREVFTLTLREAQQHCNTCPRYILQQPTTAVNRICNFLQLLLSNHHHLILTKNRCHKTGPKAIPYTDVSGGKTAATTNSTK